MLVFLIKFYPFPECNVAIFLTGAARNSPQSVDSIARPSSTHVYLFFFRSPLTLDQLSTDRGYIPDACFVSLFFCPFAQLAPIPLVFFQCIETPFLIQNPLRGSIRGGSFVGHSFPVSSPNFLVFAKRAFWDLPRDLIYRWQL